MEGIQDAMAEKEQKKASEWTGKYGNWESEDVNDVKKPTQTQGSIAGFCEYGDVGLHLSFIK